MNPIFAFILSLFITLILTPLLIRLSKRLGFVDLPDPRGRKMHTRPVPRVGGVAMACGVWLSMFIWLDLNNTMKSLLMGMAALTIMGMVDDLFTINWKKKLLIQIIVACIAVFYGGILIKYAGYWDGKEIYLPRFLSIGISILFLVGITNAINLADGLDGLAAGLSLFIFGFYSYLAYIGYSPVLLFVLSAIIGSIWGFLRFNTYPASIFMGDSGSYFLGFGAGALGIMATQIPNTAVAPSVLLLILGVPIIDTLWVMVERGLSGNSLFHPDRRHLHYRLMSIGFSHKESVIIIYAIQALFCYTALNLLFYPDSTVMFAFFTEAFILVLTLYLVQKSGKKFRRTWAFEDGIRKRLGGYSRLFFYWLPQLVTGSIISLYILWAPFLPISIFKNYGWFFLLVPLMVPIIWFIKRDWIGYFLRFFLYMFLIIVTVEFIRYYMEILSIFTKILLIVAFGALSISVILHVKFAGKGPHGISPLDVLIVLVIFAFSIIPFNTIDLKYLNISLVAVIILLYSVEIPLNANENKWPGIMIGALIFSSIYIGIRSLLYHFI